MLSKSAAFIDAKPVVLRIPAFGGWANGDAQYSGPNPTDDATITYYQKKRHIFGDLKIEVLDSTGKVVGTIPSSKRRGLSRATWSMRMPPPKVPTAATGAGPGTGPRFLPGTYTVRMTKDKEVYTTKIKLVPDPRSNYTMGERKEQFALSTKLYNMLGDMTYDVDRINGVRLGLDDRAGKVSGNPDFSKELKSASSSVDDIRKKIVATKEGGMITGEERLREYLANLYGSVSGYDGPPSATQVDRTSALARELDDVVKEFDAWTSKNLDDINSRLMKNNLAPVKLLTREEWEGKAKTLP
jgi:hypothetical protein